MGTLTDTATTILLVEDDDGHAELIADGLRDFHITNIKRFRDGQEIIDFLLNIRENPGNAGLERYLLLLDVRIPKVDGMEVLRWIKDDKSLKSLPVIMLTTTDDPREIFLAYRMGCNAYITKPIDFERFTETIRYLAQFTGILHIANIEES